MTDAVLELITRYQKIEQAYNAWPTEDAVGLQTMQEAHSAVIQEVCETPERATTMEGAVAAIRQALAEECPQLPGRSLTVSLLEMALPFFDQKPDPDPLLDVVNRYVEAEAKFNAAIGGDDTPEYRAWHAVDQEIVSRNLKATTLAGVAAALQLACHEMEGVRTVELVEPLVRGALAFFQSEGRA